MVVKTFRFILVFTLFQNSVARAQNYYAIRNDGALPAGYSLERVYTADKDILLNQPATQALSAGNFIPFNFYFYGSSSPVNSYKASENGYITFSQNAFNAVTPDTFIPANSIVAFGRDFKLQKLPQPNEGFATQVFAYTAGSAPNRKHIIQYFGLTRANDPLDKPITSASVYAFAIILHEGTEGRFDIVYTPYGDKELSGMIGCSSDSGKQTFAFNNGPTRYPHQFSFNQADFIVYQFYYGTQPAFDLSLPSLSLSKVYPVNAIVNFKGKVVNRGTDTVHSFALNYSVNDGDTITHLISQTSLAPSGAGKTDFTHPVSWMSGAAGTLNTVRFWISAPDGNKDEDTTNDHVLKTVLRNNNSNLADRNLLLEEGTGAWCGYCPDAHLVVSNAVKAHGKRVIPVAYHFDDSMSNPDGDAFLSRYISSYPDAILDRSIALGSNATWPSEIQARLAQPAPARIVIERKTFDAQTRMVTFRVRVVFQDYWYGMMRIGAIVTEDNIRGNANPNLWSQANYYSFQHAGGGAGGANHPLYNEKEFMHGYRHQHVLRAAPGGIDGRQGIVPQFVSPGQEFYSDFTYILPAAEFVSYDEENNTMYCSTADGPGENEGRNIPARLKLIGFLAEYDEVNPLNRPVINAGSEPLWDLLSASYTAGPELKIVLYPNPAGSIINLLVPNHAGAEIARVEIADMTGRQIGIHQIELTESEDVYQLPVSGLLPGIYLFRVTAGETTRVLQVHIAR